MLKISRGRFSYLHPDRTKPVTGRKLGADYTEDFLLNLFQENAKEKKAAQYKTRQEEKMQKEKILIRMLPKDSRMPADRNRTVTLICKTRKT